MQQVAEGMANFYEDLASSGMDTNVMSMTFSEFGRRIEENGSNGTDHGAASPVMLFGPAMGVNGFIGTHPDLQAPDQVGNLQFSTDFRQIYATMLKEWLCIDSGLVDSVLLGETFESLNFGFDCSGTLSTSPFSLADTFKHWVSTESGRTIVNFEMTTTAKVTVKLYNLLGQDVGYLANDFLTEGTHRIDVRTAINKRLFTGQYIYQISFGGQKWSKSMLLN